MTASAPVVEVLSTLPCRLDAFAIFLETRRIPAVANRRAAKEAEIELDAVLRVARGNYASQSGSESSPISSS